MTDDQNRANDQNGAKSAELSCPHCGEIVYAGEKFCEECGHRIGTDAGTDAGPGGGASGGASGADDAGAGGPSAAPRAGATIKQDSAAARARKAAAGRPCVGCGRTPIDADGYCESCGLRQPVDRDHVEIELLPYGATPAGTGSAAGGTGGAAHAGANGSANGAAGGSANGAANGAVGGSANGAARLAAAGASDRGLRYNRNEDAIALVAHAHGVAAVVSDGVGSSQRPEDASRAAADTGAAALAALLDSGAHPEEATRAAALRAAAAVAALAGSPAEAPSCTYVSAVTREGAVTVGWVGDSRAYWLAAEPAPPGGAGGDGPDTAEFSLDELTAEDTADLDSGAADTGDMAELGPSRQLTEDDSWAAIMVAGGALTEAEAEAHPNAHVITAWLGADAEEVRPHVRTFRPAVPGTLLVCSDGLWNYFPHAADLAALLPDPAHGTAADPLGAARTLVRRALDAGGRDNITVAVIPVPSPVTSPSPGA